jgi:protocatechuate 3,4-dioxygenase beta subunit
MNAIPWLFLVTLITACGTSSYHPTQTATRFAPPQVIIPTPRATPPVISQTNTTLTCLPTIDDGLSPSYMTDAPVRSSVGQGHVLTGVVRSSRDCTPIANAQVELWPEYDRLGHPDEARATIFTDNNGYYEFECNPPEHIHMRISAEGYQTIAQNSYHPNGQAEGTFDIVLVPLTP